MPFNERVESYTVSQVQNDVVDYSQVIRLTLESGHRVFIGFPSQLPREWLTITADHTTTYMHRGEFDRVHRLLQTESPVLFTALRLLQERVVNLSSDLEPPGEGPADDDVAQMMRRARGSVPA